MSVAAASTPASTTISLVRVREPIVHESSHLWAHSSQTPNDYDPVNNNNTCCQTRHWIDHMSSSYSVFILEPKDVRWLLAAARIGGVTGTLPVGYMEEATDLIRRRGTEWSACASGSVRSENHSLGHGPFPSLTDVIRSLIAPSIGRNPLDDAVPDVGLKLYRDATLDRLHAAQVFIWRGTVVAISQHPNATASNDWAQKVIHSWLTVIRPRLQQCASWPQWVKRGIAIDVSGTRFVSLHAHPDSALFDWVKDAALLRGEKLPVVEVRWWGGNETNREE